MNLNPGTTLGKYLVVRFLGAGAFGSVYLMHDNLLNRDVAVKFIENQNPTAFVAHFEAQILNQCRNDRIVSVNSVDIVQDSAGRHHAAIDMEYIDGGPAQEFVENGHVTIRKSIRILIDILFALEHAHNRNILESESLFENSSGQRRVCRNWRNRLSDDGPC
jgi:serine/threonine protein kinase